MMCETVCKSDEKNGANRGVVCFTFDDYHGENWLKADSLFRKYDAHVTFFIMGDISPERAEVMKKLKASGHTIGLHSVHHSHVVNFIRENGERRYLEEEIRPQLDTCWEYGFDVRSFSYPCNYRNEESDQVLFRYFDYLRTGRGLDNIPTPYYPLNELPEKCCFTGIGVGTFYGTELPVLKEEMTHAAETGSILVLYAHNIGPLEEIKKNDMPVEWLEELLAFAKASGIHIAGFDELNSLKR